MANFPAEDCNADFSGLIDPNWVFRQENSRIHVLSNDSWSRHCYTSRHQPCISDDSKMCVEAAEFAYS